MLIRFLILCAIIINALPALAHEFYEIACCSGKDCKPLPDGAVKITKNGYVWDGEFFEYGSKKIKSSPDGKYHGCKYTYVDYRPCLYVPQQSF